MRNPNKVAPIGVILYIIGSVLTNDPINIRNAMGIVLMFAAMFLFGGIVTMELIRQKKITIED